MSVAGDQLFAAERRAGASRPSRAWRGLRRFARRQPLGAVCLVVVVVLIILAIVGPSIAPYDPASSDFDRLQRPNGTNWFGTDELGRDTFSRILNGARVSVAVGFGATSITLVIATTIGTISGYYRGWVDTIIQRFVDGVMAFPTLVLLMSLVVITGAGLKQLIIILGLIGSASSSRIVRSAVLGVRENAYIEAARSLGVGTPRLLLRHVLPNCFAPIMVSATVGLGGVILAEAALSFLGVGINDPNHPTWGQMLNRARKFANVEPIQALWPGMAIAITVFSFNMLGDALRDTLDPRLRGGR
ncbi:MAG: ABC transporter permease [Anaerolinea sp.]|nr:ABC transporter permease [Anaerolinea sp.]